MTDPIPFSETPFHPEFKQLAAIVGKGKLRSDLWDSWGRIVALHSWKRVLKAANALDPDARWPSQVESLCRQLAKDEQDASAPKPTHRPKPSNNAERAAQFAALRERIVPKERELHT